SPNCPAAVDGSAGFRRSCSTRFSAAAAAVFGCCATTGRQRQSTIARLSRLVLALSLLIATRDLLPTGCTPRECENPTCHPIVTGPRARCQEPGEEVSGVKVGARAEQASAAAHSGRHASPSVQRVAVSGRRALATFSSIVDSGTPFSVLPFSLWQSYNLQWNLLGQQLNLQGGGPAPRVLKWQDVVCSLGVTYVHITDPRTGTRTSHPFLVVAKFAGQRSQHSHLELAAVL